MTIRMSAFKGVIRFAPKTAKERAGFKERPRLFLLMDHQGAEKLYNELATYSDIGCYFLDHKNKTHKLNNLPEFDDPTVPQRDAPYAVPKTENPFLPFKDEADRIGLSVTLEDDGTNWVTKNHMILNYLMRGDLFRDVPRTAKMGELGIFSLDPDLDWDVFSAALRTAGETVGILAATTSSTTSSTTPTPEPSDRFGIDNWPVSFRPLPRRGLYAPPGTYKVTRNTGRETARKTTGRTKKKTARKTTKKTTRKTARKSGKKSGRKGSSFKKSARKGSKKRTKAKKGGDPYFDDNEGGEEFYEY
jgi:hypothetical protein